MKQKGLTDLSDEEILQEKKKVKSRTRITAFLIGLFIGIATYSAVKNGLGFATFLPLFLVYFLVKNDNKSKALDNELKSRDLK